MFISIGDSVVCGRYQFMLAGPRFSATANRCANDISTPFSGFPIFQTFPELGIEFPRFGITIFLNSGPGKSHFQGSESWKISYSELGKSNSESGIRNSKLRKFLEIGKLDKRVRKCVPKCFVATVNRSPVSIGCYPLHTRSPRYHTEFQSCFYR